MAFLVTMCQLCSFGEEIQAENFNIYNIFTINIIIFVPSLLINMFSFKTPGDVNRVLSQYQSSIYASPITFTGVSALIQTFMPHFLSF